MKIVYQPIKKEDVKAYYQLVNEIKDEGIYLFSTLRFTIEETYIYVEQHENSSILGAFSDGHLIAWVNYTRGAFEEIFHTASIGMGVKKEFRRKGIGTELLKRCIRNAKDAKIEKLELDVFSRNSIAYALYKKNGFIEEGRRLKKRKFNGMYEDLIQMGLFI